MILLSQGKQLSGEMLPTQVRSEFDHHVPFAHVLGLILTLPNAETEEGVVANHLPPVCAALFFSCHRS